MLKKLKKQNGISLFISIGFSMAILSAAALISNVMLYTAQQSRNLEDFHIAFFAAESAVEEALYYHSFHKKGFEAENNNVSDGWDILAVNEIVGDPSSNLIINNLLYKWTLKDRINNTVCNANTEDCSGTILFNTALELNFSYDNTTDKNVLSTRKDHSNTGSGTSINFTLDDNFIVNNLPVPTGERNIMIWNASTTSLPQKLTYQTPDCASSNSLDGKIICQQILLNTVSGNPIIFDLDQISGFYAKNSSDPRVLTGIDFWGDNSVADRKLRFLFVDVLEGLPNDRINFTINPGTDMVAIRAKIEAVGRSRNIIREIHLIIDNAKGIIDTDYMM